MLWSFSRAPNTSPPPRCCIGVWQGGEEMYEMVKSIGNRCFFCCSWIIGMSRVMGILMNSNDLRTDDIYPLPNELGETAYFWICYFMFNLTCKHQDGKTGRSLLVMFERIPSKNAPHLRAFHQPVNE